MCTDFGARRVSGWEFGLLRAGGAQSEENSTTHGKAQIRPPSDTQGAPASHFW